MENDDGAFVGRYSWVPFSLVNMGGHVTDLGGHFAKRHGGTAWVPRLKKLWWKIILVFVMYYVFFLCITFLFIATYGPTEGPTEEAAEEDQQSACINSPKGTHLGTYA